MPATGRYDRAFLVVFALYLAFQALTLVRLLHHYPDGLPTENFYHPIAVNMLEHGVHSRDVGPEPTPTVMRAPGYPTLLAAAYALFGVDEIVGVAMNNILLALAIVFVYLAGRLLHPAAGLLAALAVMLDPIYLTQAASNQSDIAFATLLAAFAWAALALFQGPLRLRLVLLAAALMGGALLMRAAALYLWLAFALAIVVAYWRSAPKRRLIAAVALVAACQAAVVVPWMWRNYSVSGYLGYAGMKGSFLYGFTLAELIALRDGVDASEAQVRLTAELEATPGYSEMSDGERRTLLNELGTQKVLENARYLPRLILDNVPKMFLSYASEPLAVLHGEAGFAAWKRHRDGLHEEAFGSDAWDVDQRASTAAYYWRNGLADILAYGVFLKLLNASILVLATIGLFIGFRHPEPRIRRATLFLFLYVGTMAVPPLLSTNGRFRIMVMPQLSLLAALAAVHLAPWLAAAARRTTAKWQAT